MAIPSNSLLVHGQGSIPWQALGYMPLTEFDLCQMNEKNLGYKQRHVLAHLRKTGAPGYAQGAEATRVALSLQRRGLVHVTDCGMCTLRGESVLIVTAL